MDLYAELTGEALDLARAHAGALDRLPRTFLVNTLVELVNWPTFFEPEKAYFRALMDQLAALDDARFRQIFGSLNDFESRTGSTRVKVGDLETLQSRTLDYIQRRGEYPRWRQEIDQVFQKLEPLVEARPYSGTLPPRLVVILYGEATAIKRSSLWKRVQSIGTRVPLDLAGAESAEPFLGSLFMGAATPTPESRPLTPTTLFDVLRESRNLSPL